MFSTVDVLARIAGVNDHAGTFGRLTRLLARIVGTTTLAG